MPEGRDLHTASSVYDLSAEEAEEILAAATVLRAELAIRIAEASEKNFQNVAGAMED